MSLHAHLLAKGPGWSAADVLCTGVPLDRPFEERHEQVCVAAVLSGTFQYRTSQGRATMTPGALMLGDAEACFECGHQHGVGDHCLSFHFEPGWFAEIAASIRGARGSGFSVPRLPPSDALVRLVAAAEAAGGDPLALEEIALRMAGAAVSVPEEGASVRPASVRDEERVSEAIRLIERKPEEPMTLASLARAVAMSSYHFLRTFRAVAGVTPYQFILGQRLRKAATQLRETADPIADVAFEAGFGDLSTFNSRFHRIMGATPGAWRLRR
ncbi:MAG: helix-turn-helix domain-containing protein [Acetobacteraceae bacterium]